MDQRSFFTWVLISNYLKQFHNLMDPISYDRIVRFLVSVFTLLVILADI